MRVVLANRCIDQFRSLTSGNHSFYRAHYQRAKVWAHRGDPTRAIDELRPVLGPSPLTSKLKGAFGIHAEMFQRDQVKNTKKRAQMKRRRRSSIGESCPLILRSLYVTQQLHRKYGTVHA